MQNATRSRQKQKPKKPYKTFPLYAHASGRWAKKIRGKTHFFGPWADSAAALERLNHEWPYLSEGRTPPPVDTGVTDACTMKLLCNAFLTSKSAKLESGELSSRSFNDYFVTCERLLDHFRKDRRVDDLRPDDFQRFRSALSRTLGPVSLGNQITRCRSVFKFAFDHRLVDNPVNYGQAFDKPSAKSLRKARNEAGERMFEADELQSILKAADPITRAWVWLGLNCGFGNSDLSGLPQSAIDFETGWIDFPRPKTEIMRRIPLWPETIAALREAIRLRPEPNDPADAGLLFIAARGGRLVVTRPSKKDPGKFTTTNSVSPVFGRLLTRLDLKREGLNFYTLRHVVETIAGESRDQVAVGAIMGHSDSSMSARYRERISDERLQAVTATVHRWLYGTVSCDG